MHFRRNFVTERVMKHWNGVSKEMVEALSLEMFKRLAMALSAIVWLTQWSLVTGWTQGPHRTFLT